MKKTQVVVLKKPMAVADFSYSPWKYQRLEPGKEYRVEEVPNPATGFAVVWWVLKGTSIGAAEPVWEEHLDGRRRLR